MDKKEALKQQAERAKRLESRAAHFRAMIGKLMASTEGRAFVSFLLEQARVFDFSFIPDEKAVYYREGQKAGVARLLAEVEQHADLYLKMRSENT